MGTFQKVLDNIERGRQGKTLYLPLLNSPTLNSRISFSKEKYIVVAGTTGSGKTSITDSLLVIEPYEYWMKNKDRLSVKPFWLYRSMERSKHVKLARWLCYKLFKDHKIMMDTPSLFGEGNAKYKVTPEINDLIKSYEGYFEEMEKHVEIIDGIATAENLNNVARARWKEKRNEGVNMFMHISDHIGKIKGIGNQSDKQILDEHSANMGNLRDELGIVAIDIMQLNRDIYNTFRRIKTELDITMSDLEGSSDIAQNCDIALGLLDPYGMNEMNYMDYDIANFVNKNGDSRIRCLKILKNSNGTANLRKAYQFIGENCFIQELPPSRMINSSHYEQYVF